MRRQRFYNDSYGMMKGKYVLLSFVIGFSVGLFALIWTIFAFDAPYQHRNCNRFEKQTGRDTKFIKFSHWTYVCYVRTNDGKYVSIDQFRGLTQDG